MRKFLKKVCRSYQGRNFASRWVRNILARNWVKKVFEVNIATLWFVAVVVTPQVEVANARQEIENLTPPSQEVNIETKTETTLAWPVREPEISQGYHFGHWAIDIVDSKDKNIFPIDKGWVSQTVYSKFVAYGNHLTIQHPGGRSSLYAHLESISVKAGDEVSRETVLGIMGRTGWATGVHLHLEIYQDGKNLNPLEVLPKMN